MRWQRSELRSTGGRAPQRTLLLAYLVPHNIKAINQIFINLLDSLTIKTVQWISFEQLLLTFLPPFVLLFGCFVSIVSSDFAEKNKKYERKTWKGQKCWMLYNKLCFPLLINLFGIFRLEMRWQFSTDVNVPCSCVWLKRINIHKRITNEVIGFYASQVDVESYENFNLRLELKLAAI